MLKHNNISLLIMTDYNNETENQPEQKNIINNWDDLELNEDLLRGIYAMSFEKPSEIQQKAILPIIQNNDVIAQAQSGTGKTGAFSISTLQKIDLSLNEVQTIIIAPTQELSKQIYSVIKQLGSFMDGLNVQLLIGGTSVQNDINLLDNSPPHIIVGCSGRIYDMIKRRHLRLDTVKLFVLDEADEMLSQGFQEQIHSIFQYFNENIQVAIFSATLPRDVLQLTEKFMKTPINITMKKEDLSLDGIEQYYIAMYSDNDKFDMLKQIFEKLTISQSIIYTNNVKRVSDLYDAMIREDYPVCCIHSSMEKDKRNEAFNDFKSGKYRVLISSNITARGIDIQQVGTVINFDIPKCVNSYLHRIGRSGRWGRKGLAINFVTEYDVQQLKRIETHYNIDIKEFPTGE
uniref:RNA helicase n=1 Tax=viral metagenome TaxID=1070528 RepID=A0A6C0J1I4_9ZZZZ